MTEINQHSIQTKVIPEDSSLIIQEEQQQQESDIGECETIPTMSHVNGKLAESHQGVLHSKGNSDSEDGTADENITHLNGALEQLSIQSTATAHNTSIEGTSETAEPEEQDIRTIEITENHPNTSLEQQQEEEQGESILTISNTNESSIENSEEPTLSNIPEQSRLSPVLGNVTDETTIDVPGENRAVATAADTVESTVEDGTTIDTSATNTDIIAAEQLTSIPAESSNDNSNTPPQAVNAISEQFSPPAIETSISDTTSISSNTNSVHHPSHPNSRGRSVSSVNPSTTSSGLLPRSQRVWEMDRQAPECRRCHRRFNFLIRRHHCRRCGQIVCDKCSSRRIRLPVEELIEDPLIPQSQYPLIASQSQRVCDTCYREPIRRSSESHQRRSQRNRSTTYGSQMRRTDSSQSLMIDCPVCGHSFLGMEKNQQEQHLQQCLNVGSPPVHAPRYIVYKLTDKSTQIGDECPICFEEFNEGDKVARMVCLCSYHQHCLSSWLERGKGCPVHYDTLHSQESY